MAIGFPAQVNTVIEFRPFTPSAFLGLSLYIALKLGWEIEDIGQNYVTVFPKAPVFSWGDVFTIEVTSYSAVINSRCAKMMQLFDFGSNQLNIDVFIEEYMLLKDTVSVAEMERRFEKAKAAWGNKNS